ncbi:hypothetical protein Bca101_057748 [Brassica carinata]
MEASAPDRLSKKWYRLKRKRKLVNRLMRQLIYSSGSEFLLEILGLSVVCFFPFSEYSLTQWSLDFLEMYQLRKAKLMWEWVCLLPLRLYRHATSCLSLSLPISLSQRWWCLEASGGLRWWRWSVPWKTTAEEDEPEILSVAYALSIVLVSVGDGPCADMRKFNNMKPKLEFNNFQIMMRDSSELAKETAFALAALNFSFCDAHVAISFTEQTLGIHSL